MMTAFACRDVLSVHSLEGMPSLTNTDTQPHALHQYHEARKSKFQKARRVLMRKRTKLSRIILCTPQIISQLLYIEEQISSSHLKEKIHEEHVAVSNIKVDLKHFFRYAKIYSICKQEVGPLLNPLNNTLTDNKYEMCCLLVNQCNSVFTKPKQTSVIKDHVTFFLSHTTREDDLFHPL